MGPPGLRLSVLLPQRAWIIEGVQISTLLIEALPGKNIAVGCSRRLRRGEDRNASGEAKV